MTLLAPLLAVLGFAVAFTLMRRRLRAQATALHAQTEVEAEELIAAASAEARRTRDAAAADAAALTERKRRAGQRELEQRKETLNRTLEQLAAWEHALGRSEALIQARAEVIAERERTIVQHQQAQQAANDRRQQALAQAQNELQRNAGESFKEARVRLVTEWVEQARAEASDELRQLDQNQADPEYGARAKRLLDIASQRYYGHYLTERLLSTIQISSDTAERLLGESGEGLTAIGEIANVKLSLAEDHLSIRLEGQDSFGREIARRAISRFSKNLPRGGADGLRKSVQAIAEELDRETVELGRRAFKELEIPRAHPDIVRLVGRLNYRTSYSQNQWKHAVEVSFLCGMLAAELRLDVKIARRAALMHDIGKSLTHAIDGSHAVIGADYARRLGESEVVANAIGAHHLDEPFSSPYALLVAAADAMSGARPGARHEQEGSHINRIEELERIAMGVTGVDRCYALQAGRELRVHVRENQVSDLRAAELSAELAQKISDGMVFPGQIKVTVIREINAVAVAN